MKSLSPTETAGPAGRVAGRLRDALARSPLGGLLVSFDEPISRDFYRQMGRVRAYVVVLCIIAMLLGLIGLLIAKDGSLALTSWLRGTLIAALCLVDLGVGVALLRSEGTERTLRALTLIGAALDITIVLIAQHAMGSVNSPWLALTVLLVVVYRLAFDRSLSAVVLGFAVVGHWTLVGAEIGGLLRPQPDASGPIDLVYRDAPMHVASMLFLTVIYVAGYLIAHWIALGLRRREAAVRILRNAVRAGNADRVGELTGVVLGDRYDVEELIGRGGMGEVYAGRHRRTQRPVAIKVLHRHLAEHDGAMTRFRREAEITGTLRSDHIVEILDVDEHQGHPYLVFELLEGLDLRTRIKRDGPMPLGEVLTVAAQIAAGLDTAHAAAVVHRDLSPANVFLCPRPRGALVKILDFGLAKPSVADVGVTVTGALLGTPAFMAPEQISGEFGGVDRATDRYCLGATLYFALTGSVPFPGAEGTRLIGALCHYRPEPASSRVPGIPAAVDDVLLVAMAKEPRDRFPTAAALCEALSHAAAGEPLPWVTARAAALVQLLPPWQAAAVAAAAVAPTLPAVER